MEKCFAGHVAKATYDSAGEGKHFCEMRPPSHQKYYNKMAIYDFETVAEREDNSEDAQHRVNAVGLSFELQKGSFSDVYFYDDALDLQNDGKVNTDCYTFQYWPSDLANSCWNSAPPKSLFDANSSHLPT